MKFHNRGASLYIPDGAEDALSRVTDLCIAAHQDDIEVMAYAPIIRCYGGDRRFAGVTVTDGAGAPRTGAYADVDDDEMKAIRAKEQDLAAYIGRYTAQFQLAYPSGEVKIPDNTALISELADIIIACAPDTVYTHNLADKHDTHVAVALNVIRALRTVPEASRPSKVYSMEVWRGLDWLNDEDKTVFASEARPGLSAALLGAFDSQIAGGKRYDLAAAGRRLSNAVFHQTHGSGGDENMSFGLDITALIEKDIDPFKYIERYIDAFKSDVANRIAELS
jgi:LmbE family N-acetylglucosaminyl deacetylase